MWKDLRESLRGGDDRLPGDGGDQHALTTETKQANH
jgi:hypothetical protein